MITADSVLRCDEVRFWHETDLPAEPEDVCSSEWTGSDRRIVKSTRLTLSGHGLEVGILFPSAVTYFEINSG